MEQGLKAYYRTGMTKSAGTGNQVGRNDDAKRAAIVKAAIRLILRLGYQEVTIARIAEDLGASKGLVSYYFPQKQLVFLAVLDRIANELASDYEAFVVAEVSYRERLLLFFDNLFSNEIIARRHYVIVLDFMAQAIRQPEVQEYTQRIYDNHRKYIRQVITGGVESGEFRHVDVEVQVSIIIALMEGLIIQWFFDKTAFDLGMARKVCVEYAKVNLMN